jgi:acyl-CoA thioesterase-1
MPKVKRFRLLICNVLLLAGWASARPAGGTEPAADTSPTTSYDIVALGASNTEGRGRGRTADGVSPDQAFPAQLERLLESQGCHVRVLNAGRAGDTTYDMLARLPGVIGSGTKVVILQPGGNDARLGGRGSASANIESIRRAVTQRGATIVMLDDLDRIAGPYRLPDGQHYSAEGHARFAADLAPKVRAAGVCGN